MLFPFYRYIAPAWYFHLPGAMRWADYRRLAPETQALIAYDAGYPTPDGALADAAWQAWLKGVMETDPAACFDPQSLRLAPADNYRFLRRYLHPFWSWYALALRLLSLANPIRELRAFAGQVGVRRIDPHQTFRPHAEALQAYDSPLLREQPLVSVIIPTLNRYTYLADVLRDLERQDYPHFEVIVVDQSVPYDPDFYASFQLRLRLIRQEEKALWLARNTAVKMSKGDYIAFSEDDVRIPEYWLSQHLRCLEYFSADISTGSFFPIGTTIPKHAKNFKWAEQFSSGNACIRKEVFHKTGLFDRQFEGGRMGDGEFGIRAHLAGLKSISNPASWCWDVKAPKGGLRQMGHWDAFRPQSWLAPRPVPSVLYLMRKYFGRRAAFYSLLIGVPPSLMPYRLKRKPHLLALGALLVLPLAPLVLWQVWRSWRIASRMLREGAKIESLTDTNQGI